MVKNNKEGMANSGDEKSLSVNRRAVLRGTIATGATGALAGCLGSFEREYEATPGTVPEETASEHNLDPVPEVKKRSGTITQGLGVATIEADVTGYTTIYEFQGDEQQTKETPAEPASTPTPEPTSTSTPTPIPEPTTTPTDPQTAPEDDEDDDDNADQGSPQTPPPTAVTFTDKKLQSTEDGFVALVDSARLNQGGFIALRKENLSGNVTGVSDYLEPGEHVNIRIRLDESISADVTLHAVAREDDGNNTFDPATDQAYTKNGQPISDSAVVQLPDKPSVGPVKPDTLNINSTPNPNIVGQSLNPAATTSIENLIEEETEAFQQACNCTIEKPGQVEVKSVDPTDTQLSREEIGKTVFHLDKESEVLSDVPKSTELLGDEKPIELFLVPSSGEKENTLRTDLVAATKTTGQLKSGTNEAVVASYISTRGIPVKRDVQTFNTVAPKTAPETETDGPALVTKSQVKKTTDQLSGVCPSVTGGGGETTTPTPQETPTSEYDWTATADHEPPLTTIAFDSEVASITLSVGDDLMIGDQASGTISVSSVSASASDEIKDYSLKIADVTTSITDGTAIFDIPMDSHSFDVKLQDPDKKTVAKISIEAFPRWPGYPHVPQDYLSADQISQFLRNKGLPYMVSPGSSPVEIGGLFTGDLSTTKATIDGTKASVIAETHRRAIVEKPDSVGTTATLEMETSGVESTHKSGFETDQQPCEMITREQKKKFKDQLHYHLVELFKDKIHKGKFENKKEYNQKIEDASKEAKLIVEKITQKISELYNQKCWRGGWIWNFRVVGGNAPGGQCNEWTDELKKVMKEIDLECWGYAHGRDFRILLPPNPIKRGYIEHNALLIIPAPHLIRGGSDDRTEAGMVIDPWRNNGKPEFLRVENDEEWDWDQLGDQGKDTTPDCECKNIKVKCDIVPPDPLKSLLGENKPDGPVDLKFEKDVNWEVVRGENGRFKFKKDVEWEFKRISKNKDKNNNKLFYFYTIINDSFAGECVKSWSLTGDMVVNGAYEKRTLKFNDKDPGIGAQIWQSDVKIKVTLSTGEICTFDASDVDYHDWRAQTDES